ncbi:hypothetical protein CQW23_06522 [Capsicum baccatum]|uniref:Uncharacterized protein n=1 Tax=Capsicum baccatum TaxID=33114 RepID=A0A2G2X3M5_CAPBA|nr:hypothetical protein CQW23_06522 [Capsicum baccatum]
MAHASVASLLRTIESLLTYNSPMRSLSCDYRKDFSALHKKIHASVASLLRTIESLLTSNSPMQSLSCDHSEDFSTLHEKISSLEVVAKNFEKNNVSGEMTDLELLIKEVANIVEQTIQLRVTEVGLANDKNLREKAHERLSYSLQQVAEDIDRIWEESTKMQDKGKQASKDQQFKSFQAHQEIF